MGLTSEVGLVRAYNTLQAINIADGTNRILRRTIYLQLAKGDLNAACLSVPGVWRPLVAELTNGGGG